MLQEDALGEWDACDSGHSAELRQAAQQRLGPATVSSDDDLELGNGRQPMLPNGALGEHATAVSAEH